MLLNKFQLLKEDIYGNMATVYHRCLNLAKLKSILDKTYNNTSHIHFRSYRSALYTTYDMRSQTNQSGNLNDMESTYGSIVIKFGVKGLRNFLFMSCSEYKKIDPKATQDNYAERQVSRLCPDISPKQAESLIGYIKSGEHVEVGRFLERSMLIGKVKGLQYVGRHDGNCLLVFDYSSLVPLAYTDDNGKTWRKDYSGLERDKRTVSGRLDKNESGLVKTEYPKDKNGWKVLSATSPAGARELLNNMGTWMKNVSRETIDNLADQTKQDNKLYLVQHSGRRAFKRTKADAEEKKRQADGKYGCSFWLFNFSQNDEVPASEKHRVVAYSNRGETSLQNTVLIPENIRKVIRAGKYSLDDYVKTKEEKIDPDEKKKGFTDRKYRLVPEAGKPVSEKPFVLYGKNYGRVMMYETSGKDDSKWSRTLKTANFPFSRSSFFDSGKRTELADQGWYKKAYIRYYYFEKAPEIYIKEYWRNGVKNQEKSKELNELVQGSGESDYLALLQKLESSTVSAKRVRSDTEKRAKNASRKEAVKSLILSSARKAFGGKIESAYFSHSPGDGSSVTNRYPHEIRLYDDDHTVFSAYRKATISPGGSRGELRGVWWSPKWIVDNCELDKATAEKWLNSVTAEIIRSHLLG